MNKMMTVTCAFCLGAIFVLMYLQIEGRREAWIVIMSYGAGIATVLLAAIDHIIPKENEE